MAMYDVKLTDQSMTTQNPLSGGSLGDVEGGGMRVSFGGNSAGPTWILWAVLGVATLGFGFLIYRYLKRP